jgi:hypothetical protein
MKTGNANHLQLTEKQAWAIWSLLNREDMVAEPEQVTAVVRCVMGADYPEAEMVYDDPGYVFSNLAGNCDILMSDDGSWWGMGLTGIGYRYGPPDAEDLALTVLEVLKNHKPADLEGTKRVVMGAVALAEIPFDETDMVIDEGHPTVIGIAGMSFMWAWQEADYSWSMCYNDEIYY